MTWNIHTYGNKMFQLSDKLKATKNAIKTWNNAFQLDNKIKSQQIRNNPF